MKYFNEVKLSEIQRMVLVNSAIIPAFGINPFQENKTIKEVICEIKEKRLFLLRHAEQMEIVMESLKEALDGD